MTRKALQALLWKEWREHQMRLIACSATMAAWAILQFGEDSRQVATAFPLALGVAALVLPIFICMALGTERASGSLDTLLVQPIPPSVILGVKTLVGGIACIISPLTIGLIAWLMIDPKTAERLEIGTATLIATGVAATAYAWMLAFSARRSSETTVGVACVLVLVGWYIVPAVAFVSIVLVAEKYFDAYSLENDIEDWVGTHPPQVIASVLALTVAVWWSAATRFGRPLARRSAADSLTQPAVVASRTIEQRFITPAKALRWKEWRLNAPWLATFALIMIGVPTFGLIFLGEFDKEFFIPAVLAPPFLAVLIPVTNIGRETEPGLFDLLRSRAIDSGRWFKVKYVHGLMVLCGPSALAVLVWVNDGRPGGLAQDLAATAAFSTALIFVYSVTFLLALAIRQAVYAGILATGVSMSVFVIPGTYNLERTAYETWCGLTGQRPEQYVPDAFQVAVWSLAALLLIALSIVSLWAAWWVTRIHWRTERAG